MVQEVASQDVDVQALEEIVVKINRCATVVKGGKRFSFSALVVVGNRDGIVGFGFGKANEVPQAVEKAIKDARRRLVKVPVINGTIPHETSGKYRASQVSLFPASPGTGIIAGNAVRAVVELAGVHNILTKSNGNNNPVNLVKATYEGLSGMRIRQDVEKLRGVKLS